MESSVFRDKAAKPDEAMMEKQLGQAYAYYTELGGMAEGYKTEWGFSKSGGWLQKTADSKKALFYLVPLSGAFEVRMTIREGERELLLGNTAVAFAHGAMQNAKKYAEGFFMAFRVTDEASFLQCKTFLAEIMALR